MELLKFSMRIYSSVEELNPVGFMQILERLVCF